MFEKKKKKKKRKRRKNKNQLELVENRIVTPKSLSFSLSLVKRFSQINSVKTASGFSISGFVG